MGYFFVSVLYLAFIGFLHLSSAEITYVSKCTRKRNDTANSKFQENIASLVASLSRSAPPTGFANDTAGEVPDRVYGLAICRGDVDPASCRRCLDIAAQDIVPECQGNGEAIVYYNLCHLRYSDENFFGVAAGIDWTDADPYEVSDVLNFSLLLDGLLHNLTARAVSSERRFAAGSVDLDGVEKVNALVQCTRDLSPEICEACLRKELNFIPFCCEARQGARIEGASCFIRYSTDPPIAPPAPSGSQGLGPIPLTLSLLVYYLAFTGR